MFTNKSRKNKIHPLPTSLNGTQSSLKWAEIPRFAPLLASMWMLILHVWSLKSPKKVDPVHKFIFIWQWWNLPTTVQNFVKNGMPKLLDSAIWNINKSAFFDSFQKFWCTIIIDLLNLWAFENYPYFFHLKWVYHYNYSLQILVLIFFIWIYQCS